MDEVSLLGKIWGAVMTLATGLLLFGIKTHRDDNKEIWEGIGAVRKEIFDFKADVPKGYASKGDIAELRDDMREVKADIKQILQRVK